MDDTDDDLSDDELNDIDDWQTRLPCDQPWWDELKGVLKNISESREIHENLSQITEIVHNKDDQGVLKYFLDNICDKEESDLVFCLLLPAVATLALEIETVKPFTGLERIKLTEPGCNNFHPDFVSSLLAHSFLSTSGKKSFDLDLNSLDPESEETHWKLRCYFSYFHQLLRTPDSVSGSSGVGGSRGNLTVFKEVSKSDFNQDYLESLTEKTLINFVIKEDISDIPEDCIKLTFCDDIYRGIISQASPLNSDFTLKHLESIVMYVFTEELAVSESVRTFLPGAEQLSLVKTPELEKSEISLLNCLETFSVGTQPCSGLQNRVKSLLRRPSVAAVTSCATESDDKINSKDGNSSVLSLSDSCIENNENNSESELSFNPSRRDKASKYPAKTEKRNKTRKKESFNDRLKAALERGNTPDESDADMSQANQHRYGVSRRQIPLHKRIIKRQRSSGFQAFNDNLEDSEEFFTATEDERSFTPARHPGPVRVVPLSLNPSGPNLVMRRKLLQDKSFDRSVASSAAAVTSPSAPLSSGMTASSELSLSDSDSFSSEGLGMPQMEDDCMEDLAEKLEGCLETAENNLEFRNIELRRAVKNLRLRCLSESFSEAISDLDRLGMTDINHCVKMTTEVSGEQSLTTLSRSLSLPGLNLAETECRAPNCHENKRYSSLVTHNFVREDCNSEESSKEQWVSQISPVLIWIAASSQDNLEEVIFHVTDDTKATELKEIVEKILKSKLSVAKLFLIVKDFMKSNNENFYTFIVEKLK